MSQGLRSRLPRYDAVVRLLMPSGRAWLFRAFPAGPGPLIAAAGGMRPPRFRTKDVSTRMGSPTAPGPSHTSPFIAWDDVAFSMAERDRHLGKASCAAQYPAHGLPCERFTSALASCRADSAPERPARPYSAVDFHLLSFASLSWRSPFLARKRSSGHSDGGPLFPGCSLTRGSDVKLFLGAPAGITVLSAVGAMPSA